MTREEAVSIIEERIHVTEYVGSSYVDCVDIEALRIAIKALEQEQPEQRSFSCDQENDTISRQAAISQLDKLPTLIDNAGEPLVSKTFAKIRIDMLPSVMPKQRWIPCSERLPEEDD